jgi:putative SOS response-associated peptidase YedK
LILFVVDKIEVIEKTFNAKLTDSGSLFTPNYNISVGQKSLVATDEDPKQLQYFQFGFTPGWAKKQMYLFNARSEGDHNKENDPHFFSIITTSANELLQKIPHHRMPV